MVSSLSPDVPTELPGDGVVSSSSSLEFLESFRASSSRASLISLLSKFHY